MSTEQAIAFLLFAVVAAVTPGPSNTMITATGAAGGFWRGLPCVAGASVGMASLLFGSALGLGQIVLGHPLLIKALNIAGAAFLLWLAWKIATAVPASASSPPDGPVARTGTRIVGFLEATAFQWVNPKGWLVAVSAVGAYLNADAVSPLLQATLFGALFFLAAFPSGLAWLALGSFVSRLVASDRHARAFNIAMGLALAGSVAMMFI